MEPQETSAAPPIIPPPLPGEVSSPDPAQLPARPFGFWATLGWSLLIVFAYVLVQGGAGLVMAMSGVVGQSGAMPSARDFESNGLVIAIATLLSTPVMVVLCLLCAALRQGLRVGDYLGLNWPPAKTAIGWSLAYLAILIATDGVTTLLGRPMVPEFMVETYQSAKLLPLLWIALIVGAPLSEEFFFRGFLFKGLQHSFVRPWGTVVLTAALWAVIHVQYDIYGIGLIFLEGLLLGCARLTTGSVWLCIALHALTNLIATVQTAVYVSLLKT